MKSPETWQPTKFILDHKGKLCASRRHVGAGSLFIANQVAGLMQQEIKQRAHGVLLDMGCGHAPYYILYKDLVNQSICMDWNQSLHGNPHIDINHDISKPLPLASDSIDTVILSDVLEHIYNPAAVMQEIFRVMRTDGELILNVPFAYWEHEAPHDYYRYTRYALERLCKEAGFDAIRITPVGDGLGVITDILSKTMMNRMVINIIPRLLIWFTQQCYQRERFFLRSLPLGYILTCRKPNP